MGGKGSKVDKKLEIIEKLISDNKDLNNRKDVLQGTVQKKSEELIKVENELKWAKTELYRYLGILRPRAVLEQFEFERCSLKQRGMKDRQDKWFQLYKEHSDFQNKLEAAMDGDFDDDKTSLEERAEKCGSLAERTYNVLSKDVHKFEYADTVIIQTSLLSPEMVKFMRAICDIMHVKYSVVTSWAETD